MFDEVDFVRESNRIEGIYREPTDEEMTEFFRFMDLGRVHIFDLEHFVNVYQPGACLRNRLGRDVRVGGHVPPLGGPGIEQSIAAILADIKRNTAYEIHMRFETLHPFTDGNGRCGRMLWMSQMREAPLGFLHTFYYQALQGGR